MAATATDTLDLNYLSPGMLPVGATGNRSRLVFHHVSPDDLHRRRRNDTVLADDSASTGPGGYLLSQVTTNNASSFDAMDRGHIAGEPVAAWRVENMHLTAPQVRPIQVNSWSQGSSICKAAP